MANLEHITIKGYKSIKELDLEMKPINVLIGANGSGKSNFVSIFRLFENIYNERLQAYVKTYGGAERFMHFGSKTTQEVIVEVKFINNVNGYKLALVKDKDKDSLFIQNDYAYYHGDGYKGGAYFNISKFENESNIVKATGTGSYARNYLKKCKLYHFHDTSSTAQFKSSQDINANKTFSSYAENLGAFLYMLQNTYAQSYEDIVQAIQTVAPYFKDFDFNIEGETILLRWQHKDDLSNKGFSAQTLSDGTARFICMATLFLQPKELRPDTVVLDEPEIGLHPDAITVLSEIIKAVSNQGTQVIISTQSVTLANCFEPQDFIIVDYEDGESKFRRFSDKEYEELEEWLENYQMGTTWEENLIGGMPNG